jgi:hypothetical protein
MRRDELWKNFNLGDELSISGAFIYNGLRRFHEMQVIEHIDEVFEVLYNLSVGMERLLKIAVVLIEHDPATTVQNKLESSLITHNHLSLLQRIKQRVQANLNPPQIDFLQLLTDFYKGSRYNRFLMSSVTVEEYHKEQKSLCRLLEKHLGVEILIDDDNLFPPQNSDRYRSHIQKLVTEISSCIYSIITERAGELNLYTYELRHGSRAETIFLGNADLGSEELLWKELLIFLMNTDSSSGAIEFLRSIKPLDFDPGLAHEFLHCFRSKLASANLIGELEQLYSELPDADAEERRSDMRIVANPNSDLGFPDDEGE